MDESAKCGVNRADNLRSFTHISGRKITQINVPYPSVFVFLAKAVAWGDVGASGGKDSVYLGLQWRGLVPAKVFQAPIGKSYKEIRRRVSKELLK